MACEELNQSLQNKSEGLAAKFSNVMQEISDDIERRTKEIDPDIDTSGIDVWVGLDIDVTWKDVDIILDVPEMTIKDRELSLDLPQVTMRRQDIIFHTPSVRMERRKTGEYPEFYCDTITLIPKCTVRWSPIYMDVPVPFMQEQRISLDLPEFRMDRTSFKMGIPEFKMGEQRIVLRLPEFTLKDISVEAEKAKSRGEALQLEGKRRADEASTSFREQNKSELGSEVAGLFDCYRTELISAQNVAIAQLDGMINGTQAGIDILVGQKADMNDPTLLSLRETIDKINQQKRDLLGSFANKLNELNDAQKKAVDNLVGN